MYSRSKFRAAPPLPFIIGRRVHIVRCQVQCISFIDDLFNLLFLPASLRQQNQYELEKAFESLKSHLSTLVYEVVKDGSVAQTASDDFFTALPGLYNTLQKDAQAIFRYDPAAQSPEEVIVAYPGFYAIAVYRF